MTQEDKELLIKDLCARLPYETIVQMQSSMGKIDTNLDSIVIDNIKNGDSDIKPYLFPMSSMTKEQENEYDNILGGYNIHCSESYDWLNEHHFDYRGLIEKDLAIDATNLNIY